MGKLKVAIICHFSHSSIRKELSLHRSSYSDYGLWMLNIINGLKTRNDIELQVISPHYGLKKSVQTFLSDGVSYYFYRPWFYGLVGRIEYWLEHYTNCLFTPSYFLRRKYVKEFIREIKPDLVNLVGAENLDYSVTALDIKDIPIILHCQTVYANPERKKNTGVVLKSRWKTELKLFHHVKYIACTGRMYYDLIKGYNPETIIFPRKWPVAEFPNIPEVPKKYDFVYFAGGFNQSKGFNNAIEAVAIVAKKHPELKFLGIGDWDDQNKVYKARIKELGIEDNVVIHPRFPQYIDMLRYVKQARFALLPFKMDVVSGAMMEALRLGLPVVAFRTSGTPALNKKRETVLVSDIDDNEALAANMIRLYEDAELAAKLQENGAQYIKEVDEKNAHNVEEMIEQYRAVIAHYHNGTPIPQTLLDNLE